MISSTNVISLNGIAQSSDPLLDICVVVIVTGKSFREVCFHNGTLSKLLCLNILDGTTSGDPSLYQIYGDEALKYNGRIEKGDLLYITNFSCPKSITNQIVIRGGAIVKFCGDDEIQLLKSRLHGSCLNKYVKTLQLLETLKPFHNSSLCILKAKSLSHAIKRHRIRIELKCSTELLEDMQPLNKNKYELNMSDIYDQQVLVSWKYDTYNTITRLYKEWKDKYKLTVIKKDLSNQSLFVHMDIHDIEVDQIYQGKITCLLVTKDTQFTFIPPLNPPPNKSNSSAETMKESPFMISNKSNATIAIEKIPLISFDQLLQLLYRHKIPQNTMLQSMNTTKNQDLIFNDQPRNDQNIYMNPNDVNNQNDNDDEDKCEDDDNIYQYRYKVKVNLLDILYAGDYTQDITTLIKVIPSSSSSSHADLSPDKYNNIHDYDHGNNDNYYNDNKFKKDLSNHSIINDTQVQYKPIHFITCKPSITNTMDTIGGHRGHKNTNESNITDFYHKDISSSQHYKKPRITSSTKHDDTVTRSHPSSSTQGDMQNYAVLQSNIYTYESYNHHGGMSGGMSGMSGGGVGYGMMMDSLGTCTTTTMYSQYYPKDSLLMIAYDDAITRILANIPAKVIYTQSTLQQVPVISDTIINDQRNCHDESDTIVRSSSPFDYQKVAIALCNRLKECSIYHTKSNIQSHQINDSDSVDSMNKSNDRPNHESNTEKNIHEFLFIIKIYQIVDELGLLISDSKVVIESIVPY